MATKRKANAVRDTAPTTRPLVKLSAPRSLDIAAKGIKTGHDFANLMSALMSDLIEGRVTPSVGNSTCNAGGKLLKVVEMSYKYGVDGPGQRKVLMLALETPMIETEERTA
jgi:hypothetical protein